MGAIVTVIVARDHRLLVPIILSPVSIWSECISTWECRAGARCSFFRWAAASVKHWLGIKKEGIRGEWTCSQMAWQSSGIIPTRVQILLLALFSEVFRIYQRYALSGKRCSHQRWDANSDFGNLQIGWVYTIRLFKSVTRGKKRSHGKRARAHGARLPALALTSFLSKRGKSGRRRGLGGVDATRRPPCRSTRGAFLLVWAWVSAELRAGAMGNFHEFCWYFMDWDNIFFPFTDIVLVHPVSWSTAQYRCTMAMFGWYRLVLVVVVVFNTSKLTHKKLTPWMFGWRC
jgi:hypothetical protein